MIIFLDTKELNIYGKKKRVIQMEKIICRD